MDDIMRIVLWLAGAYIMLATALNVWHGVANWLRLRAEMGR